MVITGVPCASTPIWRVARCKPQHDYALAGRFSAVGLEPFVPTWTSRTGSRPLLATYVLVSLTDAQRELAHNCAGFRGWLRFGNTLAKVSESEVEMLRAAEKHNAIPGPIFAQGQEVQITGGVFRGRRGTVTWASPERDRVTVCVPTTTGRSISVQLDSREIGTR